MSVAHALRARFAPQDKDVIAFNHAQKSHTNPHPEEQSFSSASRRMAKGDGAPMNRTQNNTEQNQ